MALPSWPADKPNPKVPLFVTWTVTKNDQLRGCIGTFEPASLSKVLPEYALVSALKDSRFKPVTIQQVQKLSVAVSLLVDFEEGKKANDWEVGKHGIIIKFKDDKGQSYSATFLPEVPVEHNMTKETTLEHLVDKAGYYGNYKNVLDRIQLTTYRSSKEKMSYAEYLQLLGA